MIGDYILTIAISVASGTDAVFSLLPENWQGYKTAFAAAGIVFLTLLNLRGVKESVVIWVPVFFVFLISYAFGITYGIVAHAQ